ncbi:polyphosphate polymerase domain-containing protein [Proteiniborus sp. MB09-C3]|uniref:polyphosphate polymerase domain-containing protein n=1 Tax=Proteiniborus sp. MB09-C3 TaxID=3050072 RepID=UPI0025579A10|nr:polyphosphate polymerase domain-containing protein [Proteiniborus sp. MB09-C3]WIV11774.1 polyphosphate polymerase domain-containing protein [Proteiniborus sp. MB09-C3]
MNEIKYRHEYKFFINTGDYYALRTRIKALMKLDRNSRDSGDYSIRSIYFDDIKDTALFEKINGVNHREKFRIRFYNGDSSYIRLEKKIKNNGLTAKFSTKISAEACLKILNGDMDWIRTSEDSLLYELYTKMKNQLFRPKTIVDYDREAYIYPIGNIRVTFDKSIKSGLFSTNIFDTKLPTMKALDTKLIILEVKFDEFLPDFISDIIQIGDRRATAVSKYALCRVIG